MSEPRKRITLHLAHLIAYFSRSLPRALERLHLEWALSSLTKHNPQHPDLPWIVMRINELSPRRLGERT